MDFMLCEFQIYNKDKTWGINWKYTAVMFM